MTGHTYTMGGTHGNEKASDRSGAFFVFGHFESPYGCARFDVISPYSSWICMLAHAPPRTTTALTDSSHSVTNFRFAGILGTEMRFADLAIGRPNLADTR